MTSEEKRYLITEMNMCKDDLLKVIYNLKKQIDDLENYKISNSDALIAMHHEFISLKERTDELLKENKELKAALKATTEKEHLRIKDIFGRGTERLSELMKKMPTEEIIDESDADLIDFSEASHSIKTKNTEGKHRKKAHGKRSQNTGSRKVNLERLPQRSRFILDPSELDQKYGKVNGGLLTGEDIERLKSLI